MSLSAYYCFPFMVVWKPPYTNGEKRQPCYTINEAEQMAGWFREVGIPAKVVRLVVDEVEVNP